MNYANKYGRLELSVVSAYVPIKEFSSTSIPEDCFISMDDMEKIALITENEGIQPSFQFGTWKGYYLHHISPSMVAVCKVVSLEFISDVNPTVELDMLVRKTMR